MALSTTLLWPMLGFGCTSTDLGSGINKGWPVKLRNAEDALDAVLIDGGTSRNHLAAQLNHQGAALLELAPWQRTQQRQAGQKFSATCMARRLAALMWRNALRSSVPVPQGLKSFSCRQKVSLTPEECRHSRNKHMSSKSTCNASDIWHDPDI